MKPGFVPYIMLLAGYCVTNIMDELLEQGEGAVCNDGDFFLESVGPFSHGSVN